MKAATYALAATALLVFAAPAFADSTTVIKETPGSYSETHEGPDGQLKIQQKGRNTNTVYEGHGVQHKTSSNGVVTKEAYKAGDCQGKSVTNEASGKTVTKESCN